MIAVHCLRCRSELTDLGALLFSPPQANGWVVKHHLCQPCYEILFDWLNNAVD